MSRTATRLLGWGARQCPAAIRWSRSWPARCWASCACRACNGARPGGAACSSTGRSSRACAALLAGEEEPLRRDDGHRTDDLLRHARRAGAGLAQRDAPHRRHVRAHRPHPFRHPGAAAAGTPGAGAAKASLMLEIVVDEDLLLPDQTS